MQNVQTFLTLTTQSLFAPSVEWQDAAGEIVDRLKSERIQRDATAHTSTSASDAKRRAAW